MAAGAHPVRIEQAQVYLTVMNDSNQGPQHHQAVLSRLLSGNKRFRTGQAFHPNQSPEARQALAAGQQPQAAILACCDSRLPPEIIFDQGLGDLYVVRIAGNAASNIVVGSLEFAVEALATPLIVVLGHDLCAAMAATLASIDPRIALPVALPQHWQAGWIAGMQDAPGRMESMLAAIEPSLAGADLSGDDPLSAAVNANVRFAVEQLKHSELIAARLADDKLAVVGARYSLTTGQVTVVAA